jgi:predicted PurR-regulated permease PerM
MNSVNNEYPLYVKVAHFMVAIISVVFLLYIGAQIILPFLFSVLFAILLNPIVNFLHKHRVPRIVAILLVIIISMLIISGLVFFLVSQASLLSKMFPELKTQLSTISQQAIDWAAHRLHVTNTKLEDWLDKSVNTSVSNATAILGQTIISISAALIIIFLIPIYVFMILFYKPLILEVISKLFAREKHKNIAGILFDSKALIQSYLVGLLIESVIVSTLNVIGLLIIGVDFAILLGVIGGMLNIIPYIGGIVAVMLPMIIALTTQSVHAALWVLVVYLIVQFIDNNLLMHYVVASKVKLNALASVIVVLIGNAIWGVPGMFLSIPLTAILKVIFDRINSLKPLGLLLGDSMPVKQNSLFKAFQPTKQNKYHK